MIIGVLPAKVEPLAEGCSNAVVFLKTEYCRSNDDLHTVAQPCFLAERFTVNGALVSRDDALLFNRYLYINHDIRLLEDDSPSNLLSLPMDINGFRLISWEDCPATGCS